MRQYREKDGRRWLFILNYLIGMYGIVWAQVTADVINVVISVILFRRSMRKQGFL